MRADCTYTNSAGGLPGLGRGEQGMGDEERGRKRKGKSKNHASLPLSEREEASRTTQRESQARTRRDELGGERKVQIT
jgi:hypothetical protein